MTPEPCTGDWRTCNCSRCGDSRECIPSIFDRDSEPPPAPRPRRDLVAEALEQFYRDNPQHRPKPKPPRR